MRKKKWLYWLPVILWMSVIFYSSSQTYHEQDIRPWLKEKLPEQYIKEKFSDVKFTYDGKEISIATKGVPGFVEFVIRKAAHIGTFAFLAFLLMFALSKTTKRKWWINVMIAFVVTFLYACSDELHQLYTGDRTPKLADVMIDTLGGVIGIFVFLILSLVLRKRLS